MATTDALGGVTRITYTAAGRRAAVTDAKGNLTRFAYDATGRLVATTDALGGRLGLAYDPVGNLTARTDPLGRTTSFAYDPLDRLTAVVDALGGRTTRGYDPEGAVARVTDANGGTTAYSYDALGRLTQVTDALGGVTRYAYDARGLLTTLTDANGHARTYAYDGNGRLVREADGLGRARVHSYDRLGNITRESATGQRDLKDQRTYAYDALSRLVAVSGRGEGDDVSATFRYDAVGNRTGIARREGATPLAATFDAADQLLSLARGRSTLGAFAYDANGALVSRTTEDDRTTFRWDAAGRLVGVSAKERQAAFAYDGDGDLVRESRSGDDADDGPRTLRYALDVAGPLAQVLTASDGRGTDATTFLYGRGRIAAFGRDTRYYGADVRGSPRTTTDERGRVRSAQSYDAWGTPKDEDGASGKLAALFGFSGERQDAKLGLEYLRARWYAPDLGVFLSRDPVPGDARDPRTLSPYAYAQDDPTSKVDRSGLSARDLFDGGGAGGGGTSGMRAATRAAPGTTSYSLNSKFFYFDASFSAPQGGPAPATCGSPSAAGLLAMCRTEVGPAIHITPGARQGPIIHVTPGSPQGQIIHITPIPPQRPTIIDRDPGALGPWILKAKAEGEGTKGAEVPAIEVGKGGSGLENLTPKIIRQMGRRGWTPEQIREAYERGESYPATNMLRGGTPATRYVHPSTRQSVVIDDETGEVVHVGGPGFRY